MAKSDLLFEQLVRKLVREENTQIKIEDAKKIVLAISKGNIPHVAITY